MASSTAQKLKIREGNLIFAINAPADYTKSLGSLPPCSKMINAAES
jgi:hypothetical protein